LNKSVDTTVKRGNIASFLRGNNETKENDMNAIFKDREAWLTEAANLMLDDIIMPQVDLWNEKHLDQQHERPNFRISVGFPKHSRGGKAVAVCFVREASTDHVNEIFINPEIDNPVEVMGAMAHELIHAVDDCASGHQHFFAFMARKIGLDGKLTATHPGEKLEAELESYSELLGVFPHAKMNMTKTHKKEPTRQLKVECHNTDCGFLFRTSAAQRTKLGESGKAFCPACQRGKLRWEN
jgi:hypothetical protein